MNRLKYLFTYTIVVVIALTSNACREDVPMIISECKSDCFEIRGVLWNASANKPEVNRRIDVDETFGGIYTPDKKYGYVLTDSNGVFNIKLNKSQIGDTSYLNIGLEIESKSGFLNGNNFRQILPSGYKLNEVNNILLYVYEESFLTYNISSKVDSFYVFELTSIFNSKIANHTILKQVLPGNSAITGTVPTASGLITSFRLRYRRLDSLGNLYISDTILPIKDQNNSISFDLK